MKSLTPNQKQLLQILGDGLCHSGTDLGLALGVSRTAIWKQIKQLKEKGAHIEQIRQQGYKMQQPLILLDAHEIQESMKQHHFKLPYNIHILTSVDSTNQYLKHIPPSQVVEICCAEEQTAGRGRLGKQWQSPFGENIYCSLKWNYQGELSKLGGLSLVTSLAILSTLKKLHNSSEFKVKWPNDIYWGDKKICGNLIEIIAESNGNTQVIIGIGLNVNSDDSIELVKDRQWSSLYQIINLNLNRNELLAMLISDIGQYLADFHKNGFATFMSEWNHSDYLNGKLISVAQSLNKISGVAMGVNNEGLLILKDDTGNTHYLSSGDTSLIVRPGQV